MFIAQGKYRFSTPSETKIKALLQLCTFNVFTADHSVRVVITFEGYKPHRYFYSTQFTQTEAIEDAILSNYKSFNIKLYQEI